MNRGFWAPWAMCMEGTFAKSFRLRVDAYQGVEIDDTALNSIHLECVGANEDYTAQR